MNEVSIQGVGPLSEVEDKEESLTEVHFKNSVHPEFSNDDAKSEFSFDFEPVMIKPQASSSKEVSEYDSKGYSTEEKPGQTRLPSANVRLISKANIKLTRISLLNPKKRDPSAP